MRPVEDTRPAREVGVSERRVWRWGKGEVPATAS